MRGWYFDRRLRRLHGDPAGSGAELGAEGLDGFGYVAERLLVFVQDRVEGLEAVGAIVRVVFADQDPDQMGGAVKATPEIVVFAGGAVKESPEVHQALAL